MVLQKLDLVLNEVTELRLLVDELVNKTNMWRSKANSSNDISIVVSEQEPKSFKDIKVKDKERLSKYLALEKNTLSKFETEVVKLTVADEPLDFICSELNRHKKSVKNALISALNKALREEEIKKSENIMSLFVGSPMKKEFHVY